MTLASIRDPGGTMARGYRRCFWGTFLLLFHINIGRSRFSRILWGFSSCSAGSINCGCAPALPDYGGPRL